MMPTTTQLASNGRQTSFYYPGGRIGGPVLMPWTKFNHNHDKLFFFTGYEYFFQTLDTGALTATVPTQEMRQGNFCNVATGEGISITAIPRTVPNFGGGACQMPASLINPEHAVAYEPISSPNTSGNGFNYAQAVILKSGQPAVGRSR